MPPRCPDRYHCQDQAAGEDPGGLVRVMVEGLERAELINLLQDDPYLEAEVAEAPLMEENLSDTVKEAMARIVKEKLEEFGNGNPKTVKDFMGGLMAITDLNELLIQTGRSVPLGVYGEAGAFGVRLCEPSV